MAQREPIQDAGYLALFQPADTDGSSEVEAALRILSIGFALPWGVVRPDDKLSDLWVENQFGDALLGYARRAARGGGFGDDITVAAFVRAYHLCPLVKPEPDGEVLVARLDYPPRTQYRLKALTVLAGREELDERGFYERFYANTGVPLSVVTQVLRRASNETRVPPGLLRPQDRLDSEDAYTIKGEAERGLRAHCPSGLWARALLPKMPSLGDRVAPPSVDAIVRQVCRTLAP